MKVADRLSRYFDKLICFFVEKDEDNFKNLEEILEREKPNIENWQKIEVIKENDEFADVIEEIFEHLEKERSILVPSFIFVDPFGFSGIPFSVIERILSNPKTEVFFTFMMRDIARFIRLPELEDTFNKLFGTNKWKTILSSSQKPEIALINLYREQLHEAVKVRYSWAFRVCTSERVQTLYYLLHVTNNYKGHSIMKGIMHNQSARGDFAYLGPEDIVARLQMKLFDINNLDDLKEYLLQRFRGATITYDKIQEEVCTPWYSEPPYIDQNYRQALKELEAEKEIRVDRITSKSSKGLSRDDRITFLQSNRILTVPLFSVPETVIKARIYYKEYQQLDGKKEMLVEKVSNGSIIQRFDKTPLPQEPTDVVCPHFLELKWAYGCPFDCSWCYLKGTFRFRPDVLGKPVIKDYQKIELHTRTFLEEVSTPEILNTGEIADSLMFESGDLPFSKFIIPMFASQKVHKVLFLTKSSDVGNLLSIEARDQVIISFSLNAIPVAEEWEKAPHIMKRIQAAKQVYEAGYEVRLRIDPMVPIDGWQEHYLHLIDIIFENLVPERITFGSLRGLQSTINGCTDRTWVKYLKESSNWGKKIYFRSRYNMYSAMISRLKERYDFRKVALCKETVQMWDSLRMDYRKIKCNCLR
ncbi:MAG: Spore photoproduct lyase [Syntrophomonadaceae bacterium]|nr:Spore photoproduct lyase [Bacillota bacterium]MBT9147783.1 Spore photoproduct lyase [Bacillota bacterium]